jgi:hypothetical protein
MAGRDLDRARAQLRIGMLVGDDRDQPPGDRQPHLPADQLPVALVVRVDRDRHVGQHRLRPRGRDLNGAGAVGERVRQVPEFALHLARLDLQVGDGGAELRVPVDQPFVAVEQPVAIELDENLHDRAGEAFVHGEALIGPVHRAAEPAQLAGDLAAALLLPLPDAADELLPAEVGAPDPFLLEIALDHHLGGDPRMVGADHPQSVLALQPRMPRQDVLQRVVERVADVQRAGDVGRRIDDRPGLGMRPLRAEQAVRFPMLVPAALDRGGVERLRQFGHGDAISGSRAPVSTFKLSQPAVPLGPGALSLRGAKRRSNPWRWARWIASLRSQ